MVATGALSSVAGAGAGGIGGRGAVDRRHREHVAGAHVDEDRHPALGAGARDLFGEHLLGLELQVAVDGEHEVLAALRRLHPVLATRDLVALRVALDLQLARLARAACLS